VAGFSATGGRRGLEVSMSDLQSWVSDPEL
jgi:hypothetical protein